MANFTPVGVELVVKGADQFNSTLGKASSSIAGFGKAAVKAAAVGVAAVGAAAVGIGVAGVKAAVSFESAFAGVIKTTDGLVDEFGNVNEAGSEMQQQFRDLAMEVPTAVEELLAIGEVGGQLGIAKENLVDFTTTIAAMGEATNLTAEEAAVGFAQLANVMGTPQDQISNLGSSIVDLGNNFATNERDILNFASRLAGAGEVAGLTESDVLGISAAFSSVGIQAQAGGTATSKALLSMNQAAIEGGDMMEIFAAVAGIEADNFGAAWEDDAGAVFGEFVKGLGLAGDDAVAILDALEIKDSQATRAFLSLAGAGDLVTDALGRSEDAFGENTALAKEAAQRYATTESQFKILKNTLNDVAITIGEALLPFVNDLLEAAKPWIKQFGKALPKVMDKVTSAIKKVVGWISAFVKFIGIVLEDGDTLNDWLTHLPEPLQGVAKAFGEVVKWLQENIPRAIETATSVWEETIQPALETFVDFVNRDVIPAIEKIISWLSGNFQTVLVTVGIVVGGVFAAWAISAGAAALATAAALAPIILIVAAIGAAVFLLKTAWDKNLGGIQEKTEKVIGIIKPIIEDIIEFFTEQFNKIVAWTEDNWPLIEETISDTLGTISSIVETVIGAITDFWEDHGQQILSAVSDAWDAVKWAIDSAINFVLGVIQAVMKVISGDWRGAWEDVKTAVEDAWGNIVGWLTQTAIPWLVETVGNVAGLLMEKGGEAAVALWEGIQENFPKLIAWLKDTGLPLLVETVGNIAETLLETGIKLIVAIWDGLKEKIPEVIRWIIDVAGPFLVRNVLDWGEKLWEAAKQLIADLWDGLKEAIPQIYAWIRDTAGPALIQVIKDLGTAMFNAGAALVAELRRGIEQKLRELIDWLRKKMEEIRGIFNFSEPKDPKSPLRGIWKAGYNLITEILRGVQLAAPKLTDELQKILGDLFKLASGFSGFGGFIARRFEEETIDPIRDAIGEIDDKLSKLGTDFELPGAAKGREQELLRLFRIDPELAKRILQDELGLDPFEMRSVLTVLEAMVAGDAERKRLAEERAKLEMELLREQKKLLELQEKQRQLQFLQEQFKLLELIKEFGLDPGDILGGMELGLDASLDDLLAAMTRAIEEIIKKANDELGVRSPSRVFKKVGQNVMAGFMTGIESMEPAVSRSLANNLVPARSMSAPMAASGISAINNSTSVNFGNVNISNGMEMAQFETRVRRIVQDDMRR